MRVRRDRRPFYGWAVVSAAALAAFVSGPGQSYVFAVFVDPILAETGLSRTWLSALYTIGTGVSAVVTLLISRLVDRLGARLMLVVIALAFGSACVGMSLAQSSLAFLLGFAALRALGQGSLPVTAMLLTAQWFVRRRGRAMALMSLGLAASNAVLPPVTRALIELWGWRSAYVALGVMVWGLLIPVAILVVRNNPEGLGLFPDGIAPDPATTPELGPEHPPSGDGRIFTKDFWLLAIPLAAGPFVITALVFHQVSIFAERGLDADVAAGVFVAFAVAAATMTALAGFLVERIGPKKLLLLLLALLCVALVELQFIATPLSAVIYAVTLGTVAGSHGVAAGVTWAHYYGRRHLGRLQGTASMVMITGAALAPLPVAALQQLSGNYSLSLTLLTSIPVGCALLLALFHEPASHS